MRIRSIMFSVFVILVHLSASNVSVADCRGCCSWHGGVVCANGITRCADGSPLSSTCVHKGCNACGSVPNPPPNTDHPPSQDPPANLDPASIPANAISIASFNIQVFGVTKASNPEVMDLLAKIITQFDIVAIQEIRDQSGTAIIELENAVDALGTDYSCIVGPRLGRTSSKEQYAFFYNTRNFSLENYYTFEDSAADIFHREPFIARFMTVDGQFTFVLINIHTDPDEASDEIYALCSVVAGAQSTYQDESDFIILGDLNADCSYFNENDQSCPLRDNSYHWIISDDMDTTVSSTACTYDRIIVTDSAMQAAAPFSGVYRFDQVHGLDAATALDISDHYPVWSAFYTDRDSDFSNFSTDSRHDSEGGDGGGCFFDMLSHFHKNITDFVYSQQ